MSWESLTDNETNLEESGENDSNPQPFWAPFFTSFKTSRVSGFQIKIGQYFLVSDI